MLGGLVTFLPSLWRESPPARPPTRAARGMREPIQEASESDTTNLKQTRVGPTRVWKQTRMSSSVKVLQDDKNHFNLNSGSLATICEGSIGKKKPNRRENLVIPAALLLK